MELALASSSSFQPGLPWLALPMPPHVCLTHPPRVLPLVLS